MSDCGAPRYDMHGNMSGTVSEEEAAHATVKLVERQAQLAELRAGVKAKKGPEAAAAVKCGDEGEGKENIMTTDGEDLAVRIWRQVEHGVDVDLLPTRRSVRRTWRRSWIASWTTTAGVCSFQAVSIRWRTERGHSVAMPRSCLLRRLGDGVIKLWTYCRSAWLTYGASSRQGLTARSHPHARKAEALTQAARERKSWMAQCHPR